MFIILNYWPFLQAIEISNSIHNNLLQVYFLINPTSGYLPSLYNTFDTLVKPSSDNLPAHKTQAAQTGRLC